jgi:hypothetical protein
MKLLKFAEKAGGREVLSKVLRPSFKLEIVRVKRKRGRKGQGVKGRALSRLDKASK